MSKPHMLSLCSGIGCIDLAAYLAGFEIAGQVEINPFCQAVLKMNFQNVPLKADLKEVQGDEFGAIDVVAGGIPCQPFSSAGKQHGRDDDRYLWPEMLRIVTVARPTWVVIENVDDFTYMALDDVSADLEAEGYQVQAFVLPACAIGAPHIRERCFVVAHAHCDRWGIWENQSISISQRTGAANTGAYGTQESLAYPDRQSLAVGQCLRGHSEQECTAPERNSNPTRAGRTTQSRVGRIAHGLASWLDRHIWPALPGEDQYPQEPSRTVQGKQPWRRQRLEALGNGVVWQQIYPIFDAIMQHYAAVIEDSCYANYERL